MSSFKSCLVCEVPLAGDTIADCCVACTPLNGYLSPRARLSLSEFADAVPHDELNSREKADDSHGLMTDVAAAARFETAKAEETQELPVNLRGFPAIPGHKVLQELGQGSGGKVYEAKHVATGRKVAAKIVPGGDPIDRERFFREVRVLAKFHHPIVVEIHEVGECDRGLYFTMELMAGGSLANVLREGCKLPAERSADLVEQIARGMTAVHTVGFLHRDLKPGNILLDSQGNPKIADFGLVKTNTLMTGESTVQQLTLASAILGTPSYMSLEQAESRHLDMDPRTDVYGLGAILFHCLTGRPPFVGKTSYHIVQTIIHEEAPSPRIFTPDLPRELEAICLKCLARDQNDRYQSATDLADDLLAWKNGRRTKVRPVSRLRPVKQFLYRERKSIAWASSMLIFGVSLAFFGNFHTRGEPRQTNETIETPVTSYSESPVADDRTEAEAEATKMREELDSDKKVWLLGPTGSPRYRSRTLRTVEPVRSSFGDEYCVETISRKFVELLPEKHVPKAFVLEGEVCQEVSPSVVGLTGIYFGRWISRLPGGKFREHWLDVVYNDAWYGERTPDTERLYLRSVLNVAGEKPTPEHLDLVLAKGDFQTVTLANVPSWRKIRIIVRSDGVAVEHSPGNRTLTIGSSTRSDIQEKIQTAYNERLKSEPDPNRWSNQPFEGALGLIIHKCRSSFRNFWIQKLAD